ncbi:MAG: hypothetical protein ACOYIB_08550, partial [Desulfosporosinus sp.]
YKGFFFIFQHLCDISAAFSQFFRYSSLILNLTNCLLFYATTVTLAVDIVRQKPLYILYLG